MPQTSFRHIGLVVPQLEDARRFLTESIGLAWGPILEFQVPIKDDEGQAMTVPLRVCLRLEEPRFELIEESPGTPWVCNEFSNLHHIALWTDNLDACSEHLASVGCPFEWSISASADDEASRYHRAPIGISFEVSEIARRPTSELPFLDTSAAGDAS